MLQIYNLKTNRQKISFAVKNLLVLIFCITSQVVFSQSVTVTATSDVVNGTTTSIAALIGAPGADGISLREAIMATNGEPSGATITITLPTATITLSIAGTGETAGAPDAAIGDLDLLAPATGTKVVNINGSGPASSIISQTTGTDRIIDAHPNSTVAGGGNITLNISGVKMTGGVASAPVSGGAILAGRPSDVTALTNCLFDLNSATANGGAISQSSSLASHNLTITNCTFTNNTAGGAGGAVSYNGQGAVLITGSAFTNNMTTVAGGDGGALSTTGGGNGGTYTVEKNTFLNNQALNPTSHAGAVLNTNGTLTLRYNRFIGNTCANTSNPPLANIIAQTGGSTVNATIADNNWWGVNTGPGANDAVALAAGGTMTLTKWLQLKTTASPNPICNTPAGLGNTSTVTTSFLSNSASEAIAVSNLPVLIGLTVTWGSTLGTLGAPQELSIQADGEAINTFTSNGTGGTATVNAKVDNVPLTETSPARANITVNTLPTVINPTNTTVCVGGTATFTSTVTGTPAPTIQWRIGTTVLVNGLQGSGSTVSGANTATLTITNAQLGDALANYNVQASNHCGTANSTNAALTVNIPSVAPSGISGTTIYCNPGSTTLTAVGGTLGTGANYQWGTGNTVGSSPLTGETASTLTVSPTSTTTYWVQIENTTAPCPPNTGGPTQVVTVNQPSVAPTNITGTTTICNGSSTTLTAVGGTLGTGANYQWGTGNIVGSSPLAGETASTLTVSPTSTTTYWVRIENTAAPCTASTGGPTQLVTVNQPSVAPTSITGTTTICNGSSTTLTAVGGTLGAGANYQWGTGAVVGTSALAGETASTLTVSPTSTTTYWVRIENTTAPCPANTSGPTQVVTVNQPSVAPTGATGITTICNGGSTVLMVDGGTKGTGATTEWFTGSCGGASAGTGDAITVSPTITTTYYVRYNSTCNTTTCATVTVTVSPDNTISLTSAVGTDAQTVCINTPITDITYSTTGATGANFSGLPAGVTGSWLANVATISGTPSASGTVNYTVTLTGGCGNVTANGSISVNPLPTVNAPTVIQPTCPTPTGTITVNASGSGTLEYKLNAGIFQTSNVFSGLTPGNYNISVRSQDAPLCVASYSSNPVVLNAAAGCNVPPTISCPANIITTNTTNLCSKSVSFTVTATGTPAPTVECKIGSTVITSPYTFPVGTTTVNCTATNIAGTDNCSFTVTVSDNQPPVINTVTNPIVLLWSPNHKYQKINVSQCITSVTDNCGSIPVGNVVITYVTSDEAEDAAGNADGNTIDDMKIAANCKSVELRRERMEGGNGRVYTIHFKVTDVNGNIATATSKVVAPPNQGGTTAVDDGPVYTEVGPCYVATRSASSQLLTKNTEITGYMMAQNYPNPFNTSTVIRFGLLKDAQVNLAVYNSLGQKVAQLEEGRMSAGYHQATFDASKLAAGIYLYRLQAVGADGKPFVLNKKMIVAK